MTNCTLLKTTEWPNATQTKEWECPVCQRRVVVDINKTNIEAFFTDLTCCESCSIVEVTPDKVTIAEGYPYANKNKHDI